MHVIRDRGARQVQEGLCEVDVLYQVLVDGARLDLARPARHQRCAERLLVHEALVEPAVLAHVEALVGGVHDDGVVAEVLLVQRLEDMAYALVNGPGATHEILHVRLVFPLH